MFFAGCSWSITIISFSASGKPAFTQRYNSVMKLPDELDVELDQHRKDSDTAIQDITLRSVIAAVPLVGSSILEIFNGLAQRRQQERLNDVFDAVKNRLHELGEEKIDRQFFKSEEFQTLLFLIIERLHTTGDAEKLRMFGSALANSGSPSFKNDDKELLIRALRDLAVNDITVLNDYRVKGWIPHTHDIRYDTYILSSLSRLEALGLVAQQIRINLSDIESGAQTSLGQIKPIRTFSITAFGERLLEFISVGKLA
jgi:hypothetical protein